MDFLYWGGPVYCDPAAKLKYERPTYVFCNPRSGQDNAAYYQTLLAGPGATPLDNLLLRAEKAARRASVPFVAAEVGAIGIAGFSAFHAFANPLLKVAEDRARIAYVQLTDACFLGPGATKPHGGFAAYAAEAVRGEPKLMVVSTHGPRGIIRYEHAGKKYELSSGSSSFQLAWDAAAAGTVPVTPSPLEDIEPATASRQAGGLIWYEYDSHDHGWQANVLGPAMLRQFAVPWLARGSITPCGSGAFETAACVLPSESPYVVVDAEPLPPPPVGAVVPSPWYRTAAGVTAITLAAPAASYAFARLVQALFR